MKAIHKYPIDILNTQTIELPMFAEIICVRTQLGHPCIWAMVDISHEMVKVDIVTLATGEHVTEPRLEELRYIGTYLLEDKGFVGHVFYVKQ